MIFAVVVCCCVVKRSATWGMQTERERTFHCGTWIFHSTKTPLLLFSCKSMPQFDGSDKRYSQNECGFWFWFWMRILSEKIVSQSGFYDMALCKSCKMQLAINSVRVQVQTWGPNTQPLIKEFPLCDLMTVCLHHYSYLWTSADTNCPGAEQIMACFIETKRPN